MSNERWQQVEQLYHAALERDLKERSTFLDEACAGDEALRREVESLLAYEDQAEDFIESAALGVAAKSMANEQGAAMMAGQMIKQYRIVEAIGAGGMGEVYLAEDTRLERKVALKFLPSHWTQDKQHLRRFQQEARTIAALSHPSVCAIHEVIETDESQHCIVMEYVEGVTLLERLAEGRMKVDEALDVAIQVTSALSAAHAAGIVHRDIKLENIMLRRDGYVKILDFGLAKLTQTKFEPLNSEAETQVRELKTSPGMVLGTVAYMSPEQARGLPVDARTDIWSLGVVLFETITGHKPFAAATPMDVIVLILEREPEPLSRYVADVAPELEQIVKKALAKNREERYQTAENLLADLKRLKQDLAMRADLKRSSEYKPSSEPPVATSRFETITSRYFGSTRRRVVTASVLIAAVIVAGILSTVFLRKRPPTSSATVIKSLAVLPLHNVSGDPAQDYFADGITDALIADISKIQSLRVMSRTAVMKYKTASQSPAEIGRDLNVEGIITGSVARTADRVHVDLQLIHVPTAQKLWTKDFDREVREMLTLQGEVRSEIAEKIGLRSPPSDQNMAARSVNPEAYDQYVRGQFYLYRQTKADNEAAISALEKAVTADQNFAAAHAELAQAYTWKLFLFAPGEKQLEEKAFIEIEKALALDPNSAVAYLARGRLLWTPANHFPHDRAIKEYRHALSLNPALDEARNQLALVYCHIGAFEEALYESQLALKGDPNNHLAQLRIGQSLNFQGKYEEALSAFRAIPERANPALVGHQIAWSLFNLGKKEEASATLKRLLKEHPQDTGGVFTSIQAVLAASDGQENVAEDKIKSAIEKGKGFGHFHHSAYHIASAYALMNKPEPAIKWLEAAADDGFPCYPLFNTDKNLDNLRQDARFVSLLSRLRQKWEYYKTIV